MRTTTPHRSTRRLAAAATAALSIAALTACADTSGGGAAGGAAAEQAKIAFLMPDLASTRYELADRPKFEARVAAQCEGCEIVYANADSDAAQQQQQANSALAQGVSAMVLDPVDSTAAAGIVEAARAQGVPVIAYDRPIPTGADYYVSFDNEEIGRLIGQSLIDKLAADGAEGGVLQINGSPTDAAAGLIKKGVHTAVDASGRELLAEFDTPDWEPARAQDWTSGQITRFGDRIAGVVAANDGTGGGAIAAFKAAGVEPLPLITGNDAEVAATQRVLAGDQYNTISKPITTVAEAAADVALQFVNGETPAGSTTLFDTPADLFTPTVVTAENLQEVLVDSGEIEADVLCAGEYAAACQAAGIR